MSTSTRTIVLRFVLLGLALVGLAGAAKAPETPFSVLSKLSSDLSQNDTDGAIAAFDKSMKGYGGIEQNIAAIIAQTQVVSAIDITEDTEREGAHYLSVDWYLTLTLQNDGNRTERRREQVSIEMRQIKGKWKITSMTPLSILDPIKVV
jgi:hypothetical protein